MISVLLVDDQAVVRDGLKVILEAHEDICVVAEAADGAEAVAQARRFAPDVVVMDIRMPAMDGIEATRLLTGGAAAGPRVLVLTTFGEDRYVYEALLAGASGFLLKDAQRNELVEAVRTVAGGDQILAPAITSSVIRQFVRRRPAESGTPRELAELTTRELDVTRLVAQGLSNAEIASHLVVSAATAKSHVGHILNKLGLRDRVHLVVLAYECGFIEPGAIESCA
jgi:DNA-binding NarL/FixJ family response regulator